MLNQSALIHQLVIGIVNENELALRLKKRELYFTYGWYLFSYIDGLSDIVLGSRKIPTEDSQYILPLLQQLKQIINQDKQLSDSLELYLGN